MITPMMLALLGLPAVLGQNTFMRLTLDQLRDTDFKANGGIGKYSDGRTMAKFAEFPMLGRPIKVHYVGESYRDTVEMVARENSWHTDKNGSVRIAVNNKWGKDEHLFIAATREGGSRGVCIHSNEWGQDMGNYINCDGDANQSCGYGLFGAHASNEITKSGDCSFYWQDSVESTCDTADHCATNGNDYVVLEIHDRVSTSDANMVLFDMTVRQLKSEDFNAKGGFGNYVENEAYKMTPFAQRKGYANKQIRIEFSHGQDVIVTPREDTWRRDENGSLNIKVKNLKGDDDGLYIALTGDHNQRGVCVHSDEWGQYREYDNTGYMNCDGDADQICGLGLFGKAAENELLDEQTCEFGYWKDMNDHQEYDLMRNQCRVSDYCIRDGAMRIKASLVPSTNAPDGILFDMSVETLHDYDFKSDGGFGFFSAEWVDHMNRSNKMTPFATMGGFMGRQLKLKYSNGNDVVVTCAEDTWSTDANGSLRIKLVQTWRSDEQLFISMKMTEDGDGTCNRGVCVHSNEWGQSLTNDINCDGNSGQSCGFGLLGACAGDEMNGDCRRGFWNDNRSSDCDDADYCVKDGGDRISLELLPTVEMKETLLFEMPIGKFYDYDYNARGGFGKFEEGGWDEYSTAYQIKMTNFANQAGWNGVTFKLEYTKGKPVYVTATEDTWYTDKHKGVSIAVDNAWKEVEEQGNNNQRLFIARPENRDQRGACVHANTFDQEYNCDGDKKQICGMGLFGYTATNELEGDDKCTNGYWQDMESSNCQYADYCVRDRKDWIKLSAVSVATPEPTVEPTEQPTKEPTPDEQEGSPCHDSAVFLKQRKCIETPTGLVKKNGDAVMCKWMYRSYCDDPKAKTPYVFESCADVPKKKACKKLSDSAGNKCVYGDSCHDKFSPQPGSKCSLYGVESSVECLALGCKWNGKKCGGKVSK